MNVSKVITISSAVIIAGLLLYIGFQHMKINRLTDKNQIQAVQLAVLNDSVSVFKDRNGELNYRLSAVQVDADNLRESLEIIGIENKELKAMNIKLSEIKTALEFRIEATGEGIAPITAIPVVNGIDTTYRHVWNWSNSFLTLNGEIRNDNNYFNYLYAVGDRKSVV